MGTVKIKLPEKRFFTPEELAFRWGVSEEDVLHLIDTFDLPYADKWAAQQGCRHTRFVVSVFPGNAGGVQPNRLFSVPSDCDDEDYADLIIVLESEKAKTKMFVEAAKQARESFPDVGVTVVLLKDVLAFEAKYAEADESQETALERNRRYVSEKNAYMKSGGLEKNWVAEKARDIKKSEHEVRRRLRAGAKNR